MTECLLAATAAPSVHNTQPWLFRLRPDGVDVLVDRRRQLHTIDPHGREMFVSVGAAVFNLRLALRANGWRTATRLTPDRTAPDLAARIIVTAAEPAPRAAEVLAAAIGHRHTNRRAFTGAEVPEPTLTELAGAASAEGAEMLVTERALRDAVLALTRTAENRMRANGQYRAELAAWTSGAGRPDGVPRAAFGPRDVDAALPLRDLGLAHGAPTAVVDFEADPTIVLLFTAGDTPTDWLRAGAALERIWLTATVRGLALTPLSQVTEIPPLRDLLADPDTDRVVQTVLRLGFPKVPARPTPRRGLDEVLAG
jgi:nitroreductase